MTNLRRYQIEALARLGMLNGAPSIVIPPVPNKLIFEPRIKPEVRKYSKVNRQDKKFKLKGIRP